MLNIDATDKIEGIASVADKVEFTCSVVDGTTVKSSEGLLSNAQTQIYLAVAATRILSLTLVNTHTSAVTVNVQKDPVDAGTLYRIIPKDLSLGIGYMLVFDGQRCTVMDTSGNVLTSFTAHASNHQNGGSDEISVAELSGLLADDQHVLDAEVLAVAAAKGANNDITSLGALSGAQTIPTINLTGGQIAFPATAVPSADPNTLDDHEEGMHQSTVTCSISGSYTTATYRYLAYTKNGRVIHIQGYLNVASGTSPNGIICISLPFTVADLTDLAGRSYGSGFLGNHGGAIANGVTPMLNEGQTYFTLWNVADNGTVISGITHASVDTTWFFGCNFSYIAE